MSGTRIGAYERWPDGGERPRIQVLRALADLYGTDLAHLVDERDLANLPEPHRLTMLELITGPAALQAQPDPTYVREDAPDYGAPATEREVVVMAAHESSEHAENAERRDIGDATLEQLRADVIRIAHDYLTGEPFPLFQEMRRVRARIFGALDRRLWPRDETDLYLLLGGLSGLMANASEDLGYVPTAEEFLRSGWAYAIAIDHRPLLGYIRGASSGLAYRQDRPRQARSLAASGIELLPEGQGAARLHLLYGQAAARLGDPVEAGRAIEAAQDAANSAHRDEVHDELGGQFACPPAKRTYLAGNALVEVVGEELAATATLNEATSLFAAEPAAERSYGCEAVAHVNLARAQIRSGNLDAADLSPVFNLPPSRRIDALPKVLIGVRTELAASRYQGDAQAAELDERIETFTRETITADLRELPTGG